MIGRHPQTLTSHHCPSCVDTMAVLAWPLELAPTATAGAPEAAAIDDQKHEKRPAKSQRSALTASAASPPSLPPLTSVAFVCRNVPRLNALPHVVDLISEFVDGSQNWFISDACDDAGSIRLLRRLHIREQLDPLISDPFFRDWQFNQAANEAAAHGNMEALKWLATEYSPGNVMVEAVQRAAAHGHLEIVKYLYEEYPFALLGLDELNQAAQSSHVEIVKYLIANPPPPEYRLQEVTDQEWAEEVRRLVLFDEMFSFASLDYLKWAVESGFTGDGFGLTYAVESYRLEVIQWLAGHMDQVYKSGGGARMDLEELDDDEPAGQRELQDEDEDLFQIEEGGELQEDAADFADEIIFGVNEAEGDHDPNGENEFDDNDEDSFAFPQIIALDRMSGPKALDAVKWLHDQNFSWLRIRSSTHVMDNNAAHNLDFVKWLHENRNEGCSYRAVDRAARAGNLEAVQWLHENTTASCSEYAMDDAAGEGHLEVVKFLHANSDVGCTTRAMDGAAGNGHMDVVKFLHENRTEGCSTSAMDNAAVAGNLEMVTWLHENRKEGMKKYLADSVARRGNLPVLRYLLEVCGGTCSRMAMDEAAARNKIEVVKYLHKNRKEGCTTRAMDEAAENGHLQMVQFLHDNRTEGCTTFAMDGAIAQGRLAVVKWLFANRSERGSSNVIDAAISRGHLEVVRWLTLNCSGYEFARCTSAAMDSAAAFGDLQRLKWLSENHNESFTVQAMENAIENRNFEVMLYLSHYVAVPDDAAILSIENNELEMLRWIISNHPRVCNFGRMMRAAQNGSLLISRWLRNRGFRVRGTAASSS